jgi:hypothetical protein
VVGIPDQRSDSGVATLVGEQGGDRWKHATKC